MPKTTRASARREAFRSFVTEILPRCVDEGLISARDLAAVQATGRAANDIMRSADGDGMWKTVATRQWPGVERLVVSGGTDGEGGYSSYRELFVDYPRVWLTMEAAKVAEKEAWSRKRHLRNGGVLECGKCGCNCSNGSLCPGIPMTSTHRYQRKALLGYYECREMCPGGEGYQMSGGAFVAVNFFCEPCFERMLELGVVKRDDYVKVEGTTIFDETTDYIVNKEGTDPHSERGTFLCDSFFTTTESESWQSNLGLDTDDAAVVIANALINPDCSHKHLNISALHFNDNYTHRGYKAFAYALSINTSLEGITMYFDECCDGRNVDPNADMSRGLFAKALRHNLSTKLQDMTLCYAAFGYETTHELKEVLRWHVMMRAIMGSDEEEEDPAVLAAMFPSEYGSGKEEEEEETGEGQKPLESDDKKKRKREG